MRLRLRLRKWKPKTSQVAFISLFTFVVFYGSTRVREVAQSRRTQSDPLSRRVSRYLILSSDSQGTQSELHRNSFNGRVHERKDRTDNFFLKYTKLVKSVKGNGSQKRKGKYLSEQIDPHEYRYLNSPSNVCSDELGNAIHVQLLIFVISAPDHLKRRDYIRVTYGNAETWEFGNRSIARTVFMLGATSDPLLQAKIDDEARMYKDIVQESFVDSYLNLTRKTVMGLKWVSTNCRHARFTIKIDDDSMINKARILDFIVNAPSTDFMVGNVNINMPVMREKSGEFAKYYLSEDFYPEESYPPYISGNAYMMSTDLAEAIYRTALVTPLFPWEDVFVGMCLQKMGTRLVHDEHFLCSLLGPRPASCSDNQWIRYAVFMDLDTDHMMRVWVESSLYADKLLASLPDLENIY
ncbi:beta-1,3-galactosyltransferase 1-like [Diadema setosum]|uniref:beta-1,3-galactosyltransferase 1-like n=1 Tax=Diadema setosum TaxID=31175 RepID=UPI003B3BC83C